MDGKQRWNTVYSTVYEVARTWPKFLRRGGPDTYAIAEIALVWLWLSFHNVPRSVGVKQLQSLELNRWWRGGGWHILPPGRVPHETTVKRRGERVDFQAFIAAVNARLVEKLRPQTRSCLLDSTPLPVGNHSHDKDARWGHHRLRGYRWHTITSADRVVLAGVVAPANVHELAVAPRLVEQLAARSLRPLWLPADQGYDSESLHAKVASELGGRLVAPLNDRGGKRTMRRTPHRARLHREWDRPVIRQAYRQRGEIDRMYSVFKCSRYGLWALPPWVRHLPKVTKWMCLKELLYHAELLTKKRPASAA